MRLSETSRRLIRKLADILNSRNLKTPLMLQYTNILPNLAPFPSYKPFSALLTRFALFSVVFSSILLPAGRKELLSGTFVGPLALDKHVKFHGSSLNRSRKIPPQAVRGDIFDRFPPRV